MTGVSFPSCTLRTPLSTDEDLSSSRLPPHTPTLRNMLWSTHPRALSRPLIAITICVQPETLDYRHYTNHYCLLLLLVVATACKCAWYLNSYIRETIDGRRWCINFCWFAPWLETNCRRSRQQCTTKSDNNNIRRMPCQRRRVNTCNERN